MLITVVYLYIYFFVFTTLSTSSYYNLEESLLVRFGKYVFDYITLWPHYFFRITYNEKLLPYLGTIMVVVFMVAFFLIRNKTIRFSLIWIVLTMLMYLPVSGSGGYQPSRYRYIPLVGFNLLLAVLLGYLKNKAFSSHFIRYTVGLFVGGFLVLVVVGNIYYITLDEIDYDRYGKVHQLLMQKTQEILPQLPLDQTIVFVNRSNLNMPVLMSKQMFLPKLLFVRTTAPWQLIYIDNLLTFCAYTDQKAGFFAIQDKKTALQNIFTGNYQVLAFSTSGFYFPKIDATQVDQMIQALSDAKSLGRVMALQYHAGKGKL